MNKSDKAFCLILALIIGGCVSDNAVDSWYDVQTKKIELEKSKLEVKNEIKSQNKSNTEANRLLRS